MNTAGASKPVAPKSLKSFGEFYPFYFRQRRTAADICTGCIPL